MDKTVNELQREKQLNKTRNTHIDYLIKEIQDNCNHIYLGNDSSVSEFYDQCYICKHVEKI